MKGNNLTTEEVVSWWDAGWNGHGDLALVGNELSNGPLSVGETILIDLEPTRVGDGAGGGVHFGHICHDYQCHRSASTLQPALGSLIMRCSARIT